MTLPPQLVHAPGQWWPSQAQVYSLLGTTVQSGVQGAEIFVLVHQVTGCGRQSYTCTYLGR